ncbi:MAG: nitrilase-related carbon-nitrogen hydrolase [Nocardioides sp.]|uniref:nitrilase-related carbon-nitrogen hydrolase n=1 Tax=Nocardioides sp. TaxID=35761 RepID=UPI0039E4DE38
MTELTDPYVALAIQSTVYACKTRDDIMRNVDNVCRAIDETMFFGPMAGRPGLITLTEGALQGFGGDEFQDPTDPWDHVRYAHEMAITVPGPETERLAEKARQYGVYLAFQAKAIDPDFGPDRYFNVGVLLSPEGEVVLRHTKNWTSAIEGSTTPYDIWDEWRAKKGDMLEACYPVVDTPIGRIGIAICAETVFPETYRALALMGAEVVITMAYPEPLTSFGYWEVRNRYQAMYNALYMVCPNFGPYYADQDAPPTSGMSGGNSMVVNYRGEVLDHLKHASQGFVAAEIDIAALRRHRRGGLFALQATKMRSGLWKQIYERWPEYPSNLWLAKAQNQSERFGFEAELASKSELLA